MPGIDDKDELGATIAALAAQATDAPAVFALVAGVIQLGQLEFSPASDGEASTVASGSTAALGAAAAVFGVPAATLGQALTTRVRELPGGGTTTSTNSPSEAKSLTDALAKSIYSELFDWLVFKANECFEAAADPTSPGGSHFIGVLDIFGFEDMAINGFEQLFINTTNEQLQKVFNDIIFKEEEAEYTREQIDWDKTVFPDNTPCIQLLAKKPEGLMRIMDSECSRGAAASDGAGLVAKFNRAHGKHGSYKVCGPASVYRRKTGARSEDEDFIIDHFAGSIMYTVTEFVPKNRDALYGHVHDVLSGSSAPLLKTLFPPRTPASDASAAKMTIANRFLGQLSGLISILRETETRFVRTIKTNSNFQPQEMDKPSCLRQLVCSGVMAALEVCHTRTTCACARRFGFMFCFVCRAMLAFS